MKREDSKVAAVPPADSKPGTKALLALEAELPLREYLLKSALPTSLFRAAIFPLVLYLFGEREASLLVPLTLTFVAVAALVDYLLYRRRRKKVKGALS